MYPAENAVSKAGYQNPGVGSNYCQRSRRDEKRYCMSKREGQEVGQ